MITLHEVNPAEAEELAAGRCPLPHVPDYPHSDSVAAARMLRDSLSVDNWVAGFGLHLIIRRSDQLVIGDVGFHAPPDSRGTLEIGYGLAASARGKGYASQAVTLLCVQALARPEASTVLAETDPANSASVAVLRRCGFQPIRASGIKLRFRLTR